MKSKNLIIAVILISGISATSELYAKSKKKGNSFQSNSICKLKAEPIQLVIQNHSAMDQLKIKENSLIMKESPVILMEKKDEEIKINLAETKIIEQVQLKPDKIIKNLSFKPKLMEAKIIDPEIVKKIEMKKKYEKIMKDLYGFDKKSNFIKEMKIHQSSNSSGMNTFTTVKSGGSIPIQSNIVKSTPMTFSSSPKFYEVKPDMSADKLNKQIYQNNQSYNKAYYQKMYNK